MSDLKKFEINKVLAANIKTARKKLNLSQMKLAEKCSLSTSFIGEIEICRKFPSSRTLERILKALELKPHQLFLENPDLSVNKGFVFIDNQSNELNEKLQEESLADNCDKFWDILHQVSNVSVQRYTMDWTVHYWNKASENIYGYTADEALGRNLLDLIIPHEMISDIKNAIEMMALTGEPVPPGELSLMRKDGSRVSVYSSHAVIKQSGGPAEFICIHIDLTELKHAEKERDRIKAQLAQAQKLESIGLLAGGIAHDFNNMLSVILGHTELAMELFPEYHPVQSYLEEIKKAATRSALLTNQLLAFARKQNYFPGVLNLNDVIENRLNMIEDSLGEKAELVWLPEESLWEVNADPSQIDQILINLCLNARDAIKENGKVIIETGNTTLDNQFCVLYPDMVPGDYCVLTVSDNGCGMTKEVQAKLFQPFFTTKPVGKGTGLGLSTVFGIVKQNRGLINVYSEKEYGTAIRIYLPRHQA